MNNKLTQAVVDVLAERDALVRQNLALCDAMGYSSRKHELDSPEEHAARLLADAQRYRWLRLRLKARLTAAVTGGHRLAIEIIIGRAFFDAFLKSCKLEEETASELDAAIDVACAWAQGSKP